MYRNIFALACLVPLLSVTTTICNATVTAQNIHQHVARGDITRVLQFLSNHGNIETIDSQGNTLLHIAVKDCTNTKMIKFLIEQGANINAANNEGVTPLGLAITSGKSEAIELLLDNDADMDLFTNSGFSAYGKAKLDQNVDESTIEQLDAFREEHGITGKERSRAENLDGYVQSESTDILALKFQQKWNVDSRNSSGDTLLISAVKKKKLEVVRTLLECGANINAVNREGKTALHIAVELGSEELVDLLLSYGADCSLNDNSGCSAYIYASSKKDEFPDIFYKMDEASKNPQRPNTVRLQSTPQASQRRTQSTRRNSRLPSAQQQRYQRNSQKIYRTRQPQPNVQHYTQQNAMNGNFQGNQYQRRGYYNGNMQPQGNGYNGSVPYQGTVYYNGNMQPQGNSYYNGNVPYQGTSYYNGNMQPQNMTPDQLDKMKKREMASKLFTTVATLFTH